METLMIFTKIMPFVAAAFVILIVLIARWLVINYRKARRETFLTQLKEHLEENGKCLDRCLEAANRAFPEGLPLGSLQIENPPIGEKEDWVLGSNVNNMAMKCRQNLRTIDSYMDSIKRNLRIMIPEKYVKMSENQWQKQATLDEKLKSAGYAWMT
jgi:hypothetical protein